MCTKVAEAASVLWTFRHSLLGASEPGWRLTGEAWPDPPDSKRSQPVDTGVRVYETWRTGTFIDGLLPTLAARVVGISATCPRPPRRPFDPRIVAIDRLRLMAAESEPTRPSRDRGLAEAAIHGGERVAVQPYDAARITPALDLPRAAISQPCVAKVLQAPYEVLSESIVTAPGFDAVLGNALGQLDDRRKESLRDVVRIEGGAFVDLTLLVFARIKMVSKGLLKLRALGPGNTELPGTTATFALVGTAGTEIPPRWNDTSGPWWDDVRLARGYFGGALKGAGGWGEFVVHVKLPKPALRVEIGVAPLPVAIHEFDIFDEHAEWLRNGIRRTRLEPEPEYDADPRVAILWTPASFRGSWCRTACREQRCNSS